MKLLMTLDFGVVSVLDDVKVLSPDLRIADHAVRNEQTTSRNWKERQML